MTKCGPPALLDMKLFNGVFIDNGHGERCMMNEESPEKAYDARGLKAQCSGPNTDAKWKKLCQTFGISEQITLFDLHCVHEMDKYWRFDNRLPTIVQ